MYIHTSHVVNSFLHLAIVALFLCSPDTTAVSCTPPPTVAFGCLD